jgi:N-methylhydantoinase A
VYPGIHSALGLLTSDLKYELVRTTLLLSTSLDGKQMDGILALMQAELADQMARDGIDPGAVRYVRSFDMRYSGQGYELRVGLRGERLTRQALDELLLEFHRRHTEEYGHGFPQNSVEIVNLHLAAIGPVPKIAGLPPPRGGTLEQALVKKQRGVFRVSGKLQEYDTPLYRRDRLPTDTPIPAPAIVLQMDTTTVVPPGCSARVHPGGSLIVSIPV